MQAKNWTQPRLIVVARTRDENVLAFCKGWDTETQTSIAEFTACSFRTSEISCTGCSDYQAS